MVPVSTVCSYIVYYTGAIFWFLVLFNPLSIFLINLFKPSLSAKMAHSKTYCGDTICGFYTYLALKWPFKWAKWWIPLDKLRDYTVREQEIYFNDVHRGKEVLWALSPEAWARLMKNIYAYPFKVLADGMRERNDLFAALLDLTSKEGKERELLKQYMHYGALPKPQMEILVDNVRKESSQGKHEVLFRILCDYIERCGFSKEMTERILNDDAASQLLKDEVADSLTAHNQRVQTKNLFNLSTLEQVEAWQKFCETNKRIHPMAQQEMSLNQYAMFHKLGHSLDAGAIAYLLWHRDEKMAELIFRTEPKFGILDEKIEFVLRKHEGFNLLLQDVIKDTEEDLRKRISDREELSIEQMNKMFDVPSAAELVCDYIAFHPLPDDLQTRMLALPNASTLINLYDMREQSDGERYHLLPELRETAKENKWM